MGRSPYKLRWMAVAVLLAAGCTAPPWSANQVANRSVSAPGAVPANAMASPTPVAPMPGSPAVMPGSPGPTPDAMAQFTAEFQHLLGELNQADQDRLMADLRRTDRDLWPEVVQRFRMVAAYRNRPQQEEAAATVPRQPGPTGGWSPPGSSPTSSQPVGNMVANRSSAVHRLPPGVNTGLAPQQPPPSKYPIAIGPPPLPRRNELPTSASGVVPAGYQTTAPSALQMQISSAAATLESQLGRTPRATNQQESDRQAAEHARLRMLYMLAGRRDDALQPIPAMAPSLQDFWSKQLFGLATWLDDSGSSESTRTATTKQILDEAVGRLGESAPLVVRNMAFCTEIVDYGRTTPFDKYEFVPGQEVLLYVEVENLASNQTASGFETSLRSSYRIFDSHDREIDRQMCDQLKDRCRNPRRDFFVGHKMEIPRQQVYPGSHTLVLTIEDLISGKVGQSSIPFTVKK